MNKHITKIAMATAFIGCLITEDAMGQRGGRMQGSTQNSTQSDNRASDTRGSRSGQSRPSSSNNDMRGSRRNIQSTPNHGDSRNNVRTGGNNSFMRAGELGGPQRQETVKPNVSRRQEPTPGPDPHDHFDPGPPPPPEPIPEPPTPPEPIPEPIPEPTPEPEPVYKPTKSDFHGYFTSYVGAKMCFSGMENSSPRPGATGGFRFDLYKPDTKASFYFGGGLNYSFDNYAFKYSGSETDNHKIETTYNTHTMYMHATMGPEFNLGEERRWGLGLGFVVGKTVTGTGDDNNGYGKYTIAKDGHDGYYYDLWNLAASCELWYTHKNFYVNANYMIIPTEYTHISSYDDNALSTRKRGSLSISIGYRFDITAKDK